jgi:MYXO-CTERM domain-containing protein
VFDTGEGSFQDYPGTLAGWYRRLGLRVPDTSTSGAPSPGPDPFPSAVLLAAAGALGALFALRRMSRSRTTVAT